MPLAESYACLELTKRLLALIEAGSWDEAVALEAKRLDAIRREISDGSVGSVEEKIEVLRQIEASNHNIESIVQQTRSSLSSQLQKITKGRKAGQAYQKNRGS